MDMNQETAEAAGRSAMTYLTILVGMSHNVSAAETRGVAELMLELNLIRKQAEEAEKAVKEELKKRADFTVEYFPDRDLKVERGSQGVTMYDRTAIAKVLNDAGRFDDFVKIVKIEVGPFEATIPVKDPIRQALDKHITSGSNPVYKVSGMTKAEKADFKRKPPGFVVV